ncbi:unnamed protein product [Enterobius vermicularis]|uniref:Uncharacterized protein n=1 Tax=Enterobius vermicularis TaxID=51028 RepID=A0A0N4VIY1_ENTVE|nr:unnamed protein product [Enterobius vermicularis]
MPVVVTSVAGPSFTTDGQPKTLMTSSRLTDNQPSAPLNTNDLSENETKSSKYHGLLGIFGRGFFAQPSYNSVEENYRYLMALDH